MNNIFQVGDEVQLKIKQHSKKKGRGGKKGRAGRTGEGCEEMGIGGGEIITGKFGLAETPVEGQE